MTPNCCAVKSMVFKTSNSAPSTSRLRKSMCFFSRRPSFPRTRRSGSHRILSDTSSSRADADPLNHSARNDGAMNSKIPVTAPSSPLMKWTSRETSHTATLCKRFFGLFVCNALKLFGLGSMSTPLHPNPNSNRCEFENRTPSNAPSSRYVPPHRPLKYVSTRYRSSPSCDFE